MSRKLEDSEIGTYRGSDAIHLKESFALLIEETKIKYRNRQIILHALFLTQLGVYVKNMPDNLGHKFLICGLVTALLVTQAITRDQMRSIDSLKALQGRISPVKNEIGISSNLSHQVEQAWEECPRDVMFTFYSFFVAAGLFLGMAQGGSGTAVLTQLGVGGLATILAMITGKSLDKARGDFQLQVAKMLPFVGLEVAALETELAVDHVKKAPQTMVRVDPDLNANSEDQAVGVGVLTSTRKRTA